MLTVDFTKFPVSPGDRVLDLGCGAGRHAFEAYRRGARVVAADLDRGELTGVGGMFAAMRAEGEAVPPAGGRGAVRGRDQPAVPRRLVRRGHRRGDPRARTATTPPPWPRSPGCSAPAGASRSRCPPGCRSGSAGRCPPSTTRCPAATCASSPARELTAKLTAAGLTPVGAHHAHGLHSAYWWLKCAVGVHDDAHPAVRAYHRLLVWDIMRKPALTRLSEAALNPLIGKSLVDLREKSRSHGDR